MNSVPHKTCSRCAQSKPLDQFGRNAQCKQCLKEINRVYMSRPEVREHAKQRERERWQRDEHLREYKRVYIRDRYRNNPEHKRKQIAHSMAGIHRRRARKEANGGSYTAQEWRSLCAFYNHRCACCGQQKKLTVDHVIPLSKGGTNDIANIQPLCLECNLRKHASIADYRTLVQSRMEWED